MKKIKLCVTALVVASVMCASSAAFAQDGETRSKFYDFQELTLDGQFKKPDIMKSKAREKASFDKLLKLKKKFLPKVVETSEEQALQ